MSINKKNKQHFHFHEWWCTGRLQKKKKKKETCTLNPQI